MEKSSIICETVGKGEKSMNLEELEEKSIDLANHFKGINNWIENNKDTDPNFYEMIDTLVEYGSLTAEYNNYYKENGYPTIHDSNGERKAESYDMPTLSTNLKKVQDEVYKMFRLRSKNSFFKDEVAKEFTSDLTVESTIGNYIIPEDKEIAEKKKQLLIKVAGVYFYIWQVKQTNPNYQYDNVAEWEELQKNYKEYKEAVGNEIEKSYEGKILYSGPQFGGNIEKMFAAIEKNYKYSEIKESNSEKEEVETMDELEEINKQAEALANAKSLWIMRATYNPRLMLRSGEAGIVISLFFSKIQYSDAQNLVLCPLAESSL